MGDGVNSSILEDIKRIYLSEKLVLVHGGGKEVTEVAEKLGKEQTFIVSPGGIRSRYTDKESSVIYTMVMSGRLGKEIVTALQRVSVKALGLSGVDGGLIRAKRKKKLIVVDERGRKRLIEGGYTGKISRVDGALLTLLLEQGYLPVVSPVALGDEFELLNVDGDRAAAYVAGSMKADHLIFLTDVLGVMMDGMIVREMNAVEAESARQKMGFGMEKKILAALEGLRMGSGEAIIASGIVENPIERAIAHKNCTVIRS